MYAIVISLQNFRGNNGSQCNNISTSSCNIATCSYNILQSIIKASQTMYKFDDYTLLKPQ